jgi:lipid A ethanolaminephosphotransferase
MNANVHALSVATTPARTATRLAWLARGPELTTEALVVVCSVYFTVFSNTTFWRAAIERPLQQWLLVLSLFVVVTAVHALLLGLVVNRWTAKPLLGALLLVTALAAHYMGAYGVYLDADMLRNVLHTDRKESSELLSVQLLVPVLLSLFPVALLWRVRLRQRSWKRALVARIAFLVGVVLVAAGGVSLAARDITSMIRNHHEVRYLVTPANYLVSFASVLLASPPGPKPPLLPVGEDAVQSPRIAGGKPRLLILVVGETARAQNWGMNGYARQTTPQLSQIEGVVNFPRVTACGSSTEVSLPCMFSPFGRRAYDEKKIRSHQSLLHVLDHAGVDILWRDNQSGCKGVCDGLDTERMDDRQDTGLCNGARCVDEILLEDLQARLVGDGRDQVVVLHQLGNHGPNYFERYPPQFRRFTPTCDNPELGQCARREIVNAYDNALLYTDHVLAATIGFLKAQPQFDTALIYVSDHGESLGEKGLFLHGVPYAIAPSEQIHVPMAMWFSPGFAASSGLDMHCVRDTSMQPTDHDALFPSILGLLQVRTREYRATQDLFAACRKPGVALADRRG